MMRRGGWGALCGEFRCRFNLRIRSKFMIHFVLFLYGEYTINFRRWPIVVLFSSDFWIYLFSLRNPLRIDVVIGRYGFFYIIIGQWWILFNINEDSKW